jgi:Uma2 family endonuclease
MTSGIVVSIARPSAYNVGMASTVSSESVHLGQLGPSLLPPTREGRLRFNREAYHRLFEIGVLPSDCRIELIDGEIYMMSPIGPPQGSLITRLNEFFFRNLPESFSCRNQLPVVAGDHSEPEPDIAIIRRQDDDYQCTHPAPADVALLVEVAESSLKFDLRAKLRLYAMCGIPEYWVVDVQHKAILVHRGPVGIQYRSVESVSAGSKIAPLSAPDCQLDVAWLFH